MTELTSQSLTTREVRLDAGGEVEILVTATNVRLRGVDGDTVAVSTRDGEPVDEEVVIEATPGRVRIRDGESGLRIGPLRIGSRGGADLDIDVPRAARLTLRTLSGDVHAVGIAGPSHWASASGDLRLDVTGGPVAAESMSGDVWLTSTEPIELKVRSVSGDVNVRGPRFDALSASTTSGDVRVVADLGERPDHTISSVSGDVDITTSSPVRVDTQTVTGDVRASGTRLAEGGRGRRSLVVGAGSIGLSVRTMSGDILLRGVEVTDATASGAWAAPDVPAVPEAPIAPPAPVVPGRPGRSRRPGSPCRPGVPADAGHGRRRGRGGPEPRSIVRRRHGSGRPPRGGPARDPARPRARRPGHRGRVAQARDPRGRRPAVLPGVVLMTADPLGELLRLVSEGRLSAEEAAPILAALDERGPDAPTTGAEASGPGPRKDAPGPGSEPPGGFGFNAPPGSPPPGSQAGPGAGERSGSPRSLRIEVMDNGKRVVNLRLPIAVGRLALDRIPGLPADQVTRVRDALASGYRGSILEVDDEGDGVRIVLE